MAAARGAARGIINWRMRRDSAAIIGGKRIWRIGAPQRRL